MRNRNASSIVQILLCLAVCLLLVLPARSYNGYYLDFFAVKSNISVQYVNLVDLYSIVLLFIFFIFNINTKMNSKVLRICGIYSLINIVMMVLAVISGYGEFIGELLSKSLLVFVSGYVATKVMLLKDKYKIGIYYISLGILVIASFFLSGYKGYGLMNRVGSLGFGTNETAYFACCLIAISLFVSSIGLWLRLLTIIISVACILNVASRRGLLVMGCIIIAWIIWHIWSRKNLLVSKKSFYACSLVAIGVFLIILIKHEAIVAYISHSSLVVRYRFSEKYNNEFLDYSSRLSIFDVAFDKIVESPFGGTFGCDKLYSQGSNTHAHNLLLQFFVTYGVVFGGIICAYFLISLVRAIKILRMSLTDHSKAFPVIISLFYVIYMVFESFGYLLWNPKGVFWISLTMFLINAEYRSIYKGKGGFIK